MIEAAEKIATLAKDNNDIEVIWLYGSQANGSAHEKSDIDLAIAFKQHLNDPIESTTRPEILALEWNHQLNFPENTISIVDINLAPTNLGWEIIMANQVIYCRNDFRRYNEERLIFSRYEIDLLHHRKHYG